MNSLTIVHFKIMNERYKERAFKMLTENERVIPCLYEFLIYYVPKGVSVFPVYDEFEAGVGYVAHMLKQVVRNGVRLEVNDMVAAGDKMWVVTEDPDVLAPVKFNGQSLVIAVDSMFGIGL